MALESLAALMGSGREKRGDLDQLTFGCSPRPPRPEPSNLTRPPSPLAWEMLQNPIHLLGGHLSWDIHTSERLPQRHAFLT